MSLYLEVWWVFLGLALVPIPDAENAILTDTTRTQRGAALENGLKKLPIYGASEEIRTPDRQIRSLMPFMASATYLPK